MTDYSELKRLAEDATPGPWGYDGSYVCPARVEGGTTYVESWRSVADCSQPENTKFIAAANPAAVLALIAESEMIKAQFDECARLFVDATEQACKAQRERDQLKAENDQLRKDAARYTWLRDEADAAHFEILCLTSLDEWGAYIDGCETCQGSGEIDQTLGGECDSGVVPCPDCGGRGR